MDIIESRQIRYKNTKSIIDILRSKQSLTKNEISKKLNISKQTTNTIINNLVRNNVAIIGGVGDSTERGGKKPQLISFNSSAGYVIGSMMGEYEIYAAITDYNGNILYEGKIQSLCDENPSSTIDRIIDLYKILISNSRIDPKKILGIGIGLPGLVDSYNRVIKELPEFKWYNVDIITPIKNAMNMEVFIDNQNRMLCYGEKWFGIAKNKKNFAVVLSGEGIGSAIFKDGECLKGDNPFLGEIGHLVLDKDGPLCSCGNRGCFARLINTKRVNEILEENIHKEQYEDSILVKLYMKNNSIKISDLFNCLDKKDILAKKIIDEMAYWFAIGISPLISLIGPELIIINGQYAVGRNYFLNKITENINNHLLPHLEKNFNIQYSKAGYEIGLLGAVATVLNKLLFLKVK